MSPPRPPSRTPLAILEAAERCLRSVGHSGLSTRAVAEEAGVPLSQIHYHFGSKQKLVLAVLEEQNRRLLDRQRDLYAAEASLSEQWDTACRYLEVDFESGYVRILHEMIAAGRVDEEIGTAVREQLRGWYELLVEVARRAADEIGPLGPFSPEEVATLVGAAFLGGESLVLLGFDEQQVPVRAALHSVGDLIRIGEVGRDRRP